VRAIARPTRLLASAAIACALALGITMVPAAPASSITWSVKWRDADSTLGTWYSWQSTLTYKALRTDVWQTGYTAEARVGNGNIATALGSVIMTFPSQVVLAKCRGTYPFISGPAAYLKCYAGI
jgi:hypothetical protein